MTNICLILSESCEDDYLLYQSIQHITNLEKLRLIFCTPSQKGVQELSKIITTSSTLTELELFKNYDMEQLKLFNSNELYPVLQAALSSSTISTLTTNFGYRVCTNTESSNIEHVTLLILFIHPLEVLRSFQYLSCIAEMNSIKSININFKNNNSSILFPMPHFCSNLIMILNDSLSHSMENLYLFTESSDMNLYTNPSFRDCMACTLQRNRSVPRHNLRRSQSLCDLRTLHFPYRHQLLQQQQHDSPRPLSSKRYHSHPNYGWQHIPPKSLCPIEPTLYQSCPNLLEMQALQNMHPLLQEALECDLLYY